MEVENALNLSLDSHLISNHTHHSHATEHQKVHCKYNLLFINNHSISMNSMKSMMKFTYNVEYIWIPEGFVPLNGFF